MNIMVFIPKHWKSKCMKARRVKRKNVTVTMTAELSIARIWFIGCMKPWQALLPALGTLLAIHCEKNETNVVKPLRKEGTNYNANLTFPSPQPAFKFRPWTNIQISLVMQQAFLTSLALSLPRNVLTLCFSTNFDLSLVYIVQ